MNDYRHSTYLVFVTVYYSMYSSCGQHPCDEQTGRRRKHCFHAFVVRSRRSQGPGNRHSPTTVRVYGTVVLLRPSSSSATKTHQHLPSLQEVKHFYQHGGSSEFAGPSTAGVHDASGADADEGQPVVSGNGYACFACPWRGRMLEVMPTCLISHFGSVSLKRL